MSVCPSKESCYLLANPVSMSVGSSAVIVCVFASLPLTALSFDIGSQRDARDAEAIITWNMFQKLGLRDDDIEFYRPFYDEVLRFYLIFLVFSGLCKTQLFLVNLLS